MRVLFSLLGLLVLLAACAPLPFGPTPTPLVAETAIQQALADYPHWVLLTPEPRQVAFALSILCRTPLGPEAAYLESEHGPRFLNIYVNPTGQAAMAQAGERDFPVGSVIVKEKLAADSGALEALGLMLKDAAGHWEYAYQEVGGPLSQGDEALPNCHACHAGAGLTPELIAAYEADHLLVPVQARDEVFLTLPEP